MLTLLAVPCGTGLWGGTNTTGPLASSEPLPVPHTILALHWLDADALLILRQFGLSTQLLLLDPTLEVKEQAEWMDGPMDSGHIPGSLDCLAAVAGSGSRMYLLGQQGGLHAGRIMTWSERLRMLQVLGCAWWLGGHVIVRWWVGRSKAWRWGGAGDLGGKVVLCNSGGAVGK